MSRKFSLAYLTIPGTAPVDQIRIAKEAGYDFVSLRTIPMHLPGEPEFLLHKDAKLFEETRQALKEYDMPVMDIELARVRPTWTSTSMTPRLRRQPSWAPPTCWAASGPGTRPTTSIRWPRSPRWPRSTA